MTIFKTVDIRQWRRVTHERQETNEASLIIALIHCFERISKSWYKNWGSQLEPHGCRNQTDRSENLERPRWLGLQDRVSERRDTHTHIEREGALGMRGSPSNIQLKHKKNTRGLGKNWMKGLEWIVPDAYTGLETVPILVNRIWKSHKVLWCIFEKMTMKVLWQL